MNKKSPVIKTIIITKNGSVIVAMVLQLRHPHLKLTLNEQGSNINIIA